MFKDTLLPVDSDLAHCALLALLGDMATTSLAVTMERTSPYCWYLFDARVHLYILPSTRSLSNFILWVG